MKFTSEDLMKAMGLQVGDRIKVKGELYKLTNFEIIEDNGLIYLKSLDHAITFSISCLVDTDYEILPRPKRVGDMKCDDFECTDCPLKYICCLCDWGFKTNNNLFNILEKFNCDDQEIHDLLKARLDKEVLNNE